MHKAPLKMRNGANDGAMTVNTASVWKAPGVFLSLSRVDPGVAMEGDC